MAPTNQRSGLYTTKYLVSLTGHLDKTLVIICSVYVKNCIFEHMADKVFFSEPAWPAWPLAP